MYHLLNVRLSIMLVIKLINAGNTFIVTLFYYCTCFEHYVIIIGKPNCIIKLLASSHLYIAVPWTVLSQPLHRTAAYICDDTRCCIIKVWFPYDEHIVLETYRGLLLTYFKTRFLASGWLITKIIVQKFKNFVQVSWYLLRCVVPQPGFLICNAVLCVIHLSS